MRFVTKLAVGGLVLCLAGAALAQQPGNQPLTTQQFAAKAAQCGMAEVDLSQLAKTNAQSDDVKQFAERMIKDHFKANKELEDLAQKKNWTLPKALSDKHQEMKDRLARLRGQEFDREYMQGQVMMHRQAVSLFENYANNGEDQELKDWAKKTLPTLREHLADAQKWTEKPQGNR